MTADGRLRVLISSSPGELGPERDAANAAVRTLRLAPVMHEPGAAGGDVTDSDVFVGIYWQSYGWVPPGGVTSALEEEYDRCSSHPRLVYVKEPAPDRDPRLERLVERMHAGGPVVCRTFATPGELAEMLIDDLAALVSARFYASPAAVRELPEGEVSFAFVDIDGSTPIVRLLGDAYVERVLEPFRAIVEDAVVREGGTVVHFEGDGAFCVFPTAGGAAQAAVLVQRGAATRAWPDDVVVRARIGIHTGSAQRTPDNYAGLEVHRAARIGAAANGGQVLLSAATAGAIDPELPAGWSLAPLGSFALKGLDRAEPLLQLVAPGLERELLPPRARGISSVKLPAELTALIGRERELQDIVSRLDRHEVRLLTLTGPGGIGKSRLGIAAARRAAGAYPDGVFFVALVDATSPDHVEAAIADALGVRVEGSRPLIDTIADRLATDRVLLVLDNFEQVVEARTVVAELLEGAPGTDVLVTSRIPLRLRGEHELPVTPLAAADAEQLFLDRATAARPTWRFGERERSDIAEICRRLDGLPLAIELAAARLRVLDTADLLDRLSARLDVLGGTLDLPDRQRTLRATIDWSHDLLGEDERTIFRRLAPFKGGWKPEAAEAVCAEGIADVVGTLERLVEHSLVTTYLGASGRRMRMLETIRQYAVERLEESGEAEAIHARHAAYFDCFVNDLRPLLDGAEAAQAMAVLDDDWENIESVVVPWRVARGDYASLVALAAVTWRYVWLFDRVQEATAWMEHAYDVRDTLEPPLRGELCRLWGSALYQRGEYERSRAVLGDAIELLAEWGPPHREAWARALLAGLLPHFDVNLEVSLAEVTRAVGLFRAESNDFGLATALGFLGTILTLLGDAEQGRIHLEESIEVGERVGIPSLLGANHTLRALAALPAGETEEARRHLEIAASMPMYLEGTAYCLEGFAAVELAEGDVVRAATALGAAEGLRERTGIQMWPVMRMTLQPAIDAIDAAGPEAQAARYEGRRMSPPSALEQLARPLALA